ncbi:hypothetical protein CKM354_001270000 [Cercospora kikuchii]|uniref:Uncharacterized protein n=1 Tax=Cercospora kikuchii TaxID=84275 RepID=A0A9P3FMG4_9PEZI|nr:uncharacterized protein CKM354_001270000 [Cercospora kikuchii]GIZ49672.1 hypothetical protein CKM354_001270000 [Cercospora kikuchii]
MQATAAPPLSRGTSTMQDGTFIHTIPYDLHAAIHSGSIDYNNMFDIISTRFSPELSNDLSDFHSRQHSRQADMQYEMQLADIVSISVFDKNGEERPVCLPVGNPGEHGFHNIGSYPSLSPASSTELTMESSTSPSVKWARKYFGCFDGFTGDIILHAFSPSASKTGQSYKLREFFNDDGLLRGLNDKYCQWFVTITAGDAVFNLCWGALTVEMFISAYKELPLEYIAFTDEIQIIVERSRKNRSIRALWFFTRHPMQYTTFGGRGVTLSDCRFVDFAVNMGRCLVNLPPLAASITSFEMEELGLSEPLHLSPALPFCGGLRGWDRDRSRTFLRTDYYPEDLHLFTPQQQEMWLALSTERDYTLPEPNRYKLLDPLPEYVEEVVVRLFPDTLPDYERQRRWERSRQEVDRNMGKDMNPASCEQRALTRISNRQLAEDNPSLTMNAIAKRAAKAQETSEQREIRLSKRRARSKVLTARKQQEYDDELKAQGIENGANGKKKMTPRMAANAAKRAKETQEEREARLKNAREGYRAKVKRQKEAARNAEDSETSNSANEEDDTVLDESAQEMEE